MFYFKQYFYRPLGGGSLGGLRGHYSAPCNWIFLIYYSEKKNWIRKVWTSFAAVTEMRYWKIWTNGFFLFALTLLEKIYQWPKAVAFTSIFILLICHTLFPSPLSTRQLLNIFWTGYSSPGFYWHPTHRLCTKSSVGVNLKVSTCNISFTSKLNEQFLCTPKKRTFSLSLYLSSQQGSIPPLTNFVIYPLCFLIAFIVTSRPQLISK